MEEFGDRVQASGMYLLCRPVRTHAAYHPSVTEAPSPDPASEYRLWNRAIGEHFFPVGAGEAPVYLSFDDALAAQVGRSLGLPIASFEAAVASVIEVESDNPFLRADYTLGDHLGVLGLLAAQVLIATRMGSFTADATTAYWKPFQRAFTGDRPLKQAALDTLDMFWHKTKAHYATLHRGRLSVQADPSKIPLAGKRHINLPLFQALLRETDRAQLRSWLRDYPDEKRLPPTTLLRHLINSAIIFNKKLAQTLREAATNAVLATAIETLLQELVTQSTGDERRVQRAAGRLQLVGLGRLECTLQRRDGQNRWVDVRDALDDEAIRDGCEDETSGARWRGDSRVLFLEGGPFQGFVSHHGYVNTGVQAVLLHQEDDLEVVRRLRASAAEELPLAAPIESFRAHRVIVSEDDDELLDLFSCQLSTARAIRLEGGLSDRRVWLSSRPPKIVVAQGITRVVINGEARTVDPNGEVTLRAPYPPGHYVVQAADDRVDFDVEDGERLHDAKDGEEIVYELTPALETIRIEQLSAQRYLVGAYIGENPS